MAKKTRVSTGEAPNPNSVPNRDILQRLNFLYQASNFFNTLAVENTPSSSKETCKPSTTDSSSTLENGSSDPSSSKRNGGSQPCRKKKRRRRQQITTQTLSRTLVASMKVTGQKTNVRMDPTVKRTICKGCNSLLWPGSTASVRVKSLSSHGHAVTYKCNHCSTVRRIPAPPISGPTDHEVDDNEATSTIEATDTTSDVHPELKRRRRKKRSQARPPPFFAREGHVVFSGNEIVRYEDTQRTEETATIS